MGGAEQFTNHLTWFTCQISAGRHQRERADSEFVHRRFTVCSTLPCMELHGMAKTPVHPGKDRACMLRNLGVGRSIGFLFVAASVFSTSFAMGQDDAPRGGS